jgi:transcriptional regulator with XRE-family HTH domain
LKQAAPEIGVSYTYLSKLENGHVEPSDETLRRLAAYYGVDGDALGALAGRLPADVTAYLQEDPERVLALLRSHFGGPR